ncbi:MAG TPA: glycosyltransferase family A protein [Thermoanaerobaculia bacterium]
MSRPFLSVVVPAYNSERTIAEALESVLAQTPPNTEVIIVDDGSTDGTVAVAESFGYLVRVVRAPHSGIARTFNRGMQEARGEWIASIDADDRWLPHKLERQFAALEADPSIDVVFGFVRQFVSPELMDQRWRFAISDDPVPGLHRGGLLMRREVWERVGEFDTKLTAGEFVGWYARAVDAGVTMHMIPDVVYERRVHDNNTVRRERATLDSNYLRVLKATLDRRRTEKNG